MGKVQCVSIKRQSMSWKIIEKSLNNIHNTLEKKIHDEYHQLKTKVSRKGKNYESCTTIVNGKYLLTEIENVDKIEKEERIEKYHQTEPCDESLEDTLVSHIPLKKKFQRFKKWYKMINYNANVQKTLQPKSKTPLQDKVYNKNFEVKTMQTHTPTKVEIVGLKPFGADHNSPSSMSVVYGESNSDSNRCRIDKNQLKINPNISSIDYEQGVTNLNNSLASFFNQNRVKTLTSDRQVTSNNNKSLNSTIINFNGENLPYEKNLNYFYSRNKEQFLERVFKGPPDSMRWISWMVAAEVPNNENRSIEVFRHFFEEKLEEKVDSQIKKDLNRTLSEITNEFILNNLTNFNVLNESEFHKITQEHLYRVLRAFSSNDKEVSYCQGMNFIAGFLLIASDFNEVEVFYLLVALFSDTYKDNLGIRGFFSDSFPLLKAYLYIFNHFFAEKMPELKRHFESLDIPDEVWVGKWFQTLFTVSMPLNVVMRLWDCIFSYGLEFIISFSLAIVKHLENDLIKMEDPFNVIEFFKNVLGAGSHLNIKKFPKVNVEDIITSAKKLFLNNFSKKNIEIIKKEFEKKNNIDLSFLKTKYDLKLKVNRIESSSCTNSNNSACMENNLENNLESLCNLESKNTQMFNNNTKKSTTANSNTIEHEEQYNGIKNNFNTYVNHFKNLTEIESDKENEDDDVNDEDDQITIGGVLGENSKITKIQNKISKYTLNVIKRRISFDPKAG